MGEVSLMPGGRIRRPRSPAGFILAALLSLLLGAALVLPRDPVELEATEITYLAAACSLAFDRDWHYETVDEDRLESLSLRREDLRLRPSSVGGGQTFDVPPVYPMVLAPFVWLAPHRGPAVANVLLLIVTVLAVVTRLGRRVGHGAAALVGICLFASVMYRSVFLVSPVMLLATCVAVAFHLALRHEEPAAHGLRELYRPQETALVSMLIAGATGAAIGVAALQHPLFFLLVWPAAAAMPSGRRRGGITGVSLGLVTVLAIPAAVGSLWGLPLGRLPEGLIDALAQTSVGSTTWNLLYFAIGRNVGVLPYLLPAVALLGLWKGGTGRSTLALTAVLGALLNVVINPFNFYWGPAAVGNGWSIPWFVLLWFVPTRPLPAGWLAATALLSAVGMYPTWLAPGVEPVTAEGVYRHAAGRLHRYLPLETTQQALPPGEVMGNRFWIRSLSLATRVSGASRWILSGDDWNEIQLAAPTELAALHLQFGPQAEAALEVRGADLGDMVLLPDGGVGFRLEALRRRALHPMWWSPERHFNYVVQFRMPMVEPRAQTLSITAIAADLEPRKP